jgi:hypothetical protein
VAPKLLGAAKMIDVLAAIRPAAPRQTFLPLLLLTLLKSISLPTDEGREEYTSWSDINHRQDLGIAW